MAYEGAYRCAVLTPTRELFADDIYYADVPGFVGHYGVIKGHEIKKDMFSEDEETGGIFISNQGIRILVRKLEAKMSMQMNYLEYLDHPTTFRRGIWWQVKMLAQGIDTEDLSIYKPIRTR